MEILSTETAKPSISTLVDEFLNVQAFQIGRKKKKKKKTRNSWHLTFKKKTKTENKVPVQA